MTPQWAADPVRAPPCVGHEHGVPPLHDLTALTHSERLYHPQYMNNVHARNNGSRSGDVLFPAPCGRGRSAHGQRSDRRRESARVNADFP